MRRWLHIMWLAVTGIGVGFGMAALLKDDVPDAVFYGLGLIVALALTAAYGRFADRFDRPS
ncbi:MAG TPA: hypothetical protein VHG69_01320 [Thermoleophilaceae bacterium]|nr:hypothetical protein [Thermoleophilaceae bacterium]